MSTDKAAVPVHLGLILDGNRRWAKKHGLTTAEGHWAGFRNLKTMADYVFDEGVSYLSVYAFSTENWQRSKDEIAQLMKIFLWVARHEAKELHKKGVQFKVIGSRLKLGKSLVKAIHDAEELTKDNDRGTLLLCLDYGGQQEIVDAMKAIVASGVAPEAVTAQMISDHLYAPEVPPLDLIVRTSGEQRLSNFMLWRAAYSELMFTSSNWPELTKAELQTMLGDYAQRQRRFGA
jgi:undecaprenyl diphosphate synthase